MFFFLNFSLQKWSFSSESMMGERFGSTRCNFMKKIRPLLGAYCHRNEFFSHNLSREPPRKSENEAQGVCVFFFFMGGKRT